MLTCSKEVEVEFGPALLDSTAHILTTALFSCLCYYIVVLTLRNVSSSRSCSSEGNRVRNDITLRAVVKA